MTPAMRRPWALVGAMIGVLVAVCAAWTAIDSRPPAWDHANHLERALECAKDLGTGDVVALLERSSFYPPLVLCSAGALYRWLPSDELAARIVLWLFLGLGVIATFLLGRRAGGETAGVAAALVFGTAPFVVSVALHFQLDLPLAAMVALTLWAVLNTGHFTRRGWVVLTGVLFGLGMLTKPSFAVYVLPAVGIAVLREIRRPGVLLNLTLAVLAGSLVALPWYGPRATGILAQIGARSGKQAAESGHPDPFSWLGLSFYPTWIVPQLGLVAVLLLLIGVAIAIRRRHGILVASVVVPLALFMLIHNKNLRYTLPILPAAAVLAGLAFAALGVRTRRMAAGALVVIGIVQVSGAAFGVPGPWIALFGIPWATQSPPQRVDWKHRELLAILAREARGEAVTVSVVPNGAYFSVSNFRYYALRDGLRWRWARAWDDTPLGIDFMVLKTGDQGPSWTEEKPRRIAERLARDPHLARVFPVIADVDLPDGSTGTLRARRVPPYAAPPATIERAVDAAVRGMVPLFARDVEGLHVALESDPDIVRGRIARLVISADAARIGELKRPDSAILRVRDLRIVAEELVVNPGSAVETGRLELLDAKRLTIERATITSEDLAAFLAGLKRFRSATLALEDGAARIHLRQSGPDVSARIRILPLPDRPFGIDAGDVRVGGVPVPAALVNWVIRNYDPTPRLAARMPVPVGIGDVAIAPDAIRIRPGKESAGR